MSPSVSDANVFSDDFSTEPYWWGDVPRPELAPPAPPPRCDVLVIGSGYTGLSAALHTARAGRHTVVLDAQDAGWGCSTRNGGQISTSIKPGYDELRARHGAEKALGVLREGHAALAWIGSFIAAEGIDCDFTICGRFHAAHNPAGYERLARSLDAQPAGLETEAFAVPRNEMQRELGTTAYHGGVVFPRHAALHPARFHKGLLDRVLGAGAGVFAHCPATAIDRAGDGFIVRTPAGSIAADNVIVASNGYTGAVTPWQRRRVIPIGSYIIATEPLDPALMARLMPANRIVSDTRKVVYYYRASPDRRRILFGGRVSFNEADPQKSAPRLRSDLIRIFPELVSTRISHSWMGFVAYTFDTLAHVGRHEGIHYAMGYCGSGVSMAAYLGMRVGQQVLGQREGATAFDGIRFQTRPLYTGNPWFLAPSIGYYRWRDRLNR